MVGEGRKPNSENTEARKSEKALGVDNELQ